MSSNTTCYDSDGTVANGNYPCGFPNISTCCGYGWDCLSNGLCRLHGTTGYAQSTCTNPSYENCNSFCNQSQFDGFGEVSRCEPNGNSWCCAGAAGQGLGGPDCCNTTLTTSLEPYPFSAIDNSGQSTAASYLVSSTAALTTPVPLGTILASPSSASLGRGTSVHSTSPTVATLKSTSPTSVAISTQISSTPSTTSASSPSPQPTAQSHNSKTAIEVGIPVAILVVLLAVLAFFIFQNRKFKQHLLRLRSQMAEGSLVRENARPEMQEHEGGTIGELDLTHYELTQHDAPKHELLGNEVHEIYHNGAPEHELVGDGPPR